MESASFPSIPVFNAAAPALREPFLNNNASRENKVAPRGSIVYFLAAAFAFFIYSRMHEFASVITGINIYVFTIIVPLTLAAMLLSGKVVTPLFTRAGILLLFFTFWVVVGIPFSVWPGGSYASFRENWMVSMLTFIIIGGAADSIRRCRQFAYIIGWALLLDVLLIARYTAYVNGRISMGFGLLSNANDMATHLLIGLPFCILIAIDAPGWNSAKRWFGLALSFAVIVQSMRSGSRGGVLTVCAMFILSFLLVTGANKIKLALAAALLLVIGIPLLPRAVLVRYQLLVSPIEEVEVESSQEALDAGYAAGSSQGRRKLLEGGIRLAMQHPIFGVGIGQFQVEYSKAAIAQGMGAYESWHATHNVYVQIAAETGIPGFLFYISVVVWCFRKCLLLHRRARQHNNSETGNLAFALALSLGGFMVSACFSNIAYHFYFPFLAGLTVALAAAAEPMLGAAPAEAAANSYPLQGGGWAAVRQPSQR
jgi:O-antigen ligase